MSGFRGFLEAGRREGEYRGIIHGPHFVKWTRTASRT